MMAMVSHELNNPLAAVTSSVYLLCKETLPPRAKEFADIAQLELSRLAHITRLVLGFYKDTEHPIAIDPCDLIKGVIETLSDRFAAVKPRIICDFAWQGTFALPVRQAQEALDNILGNSFESGATQIRVRVRRSNDWRSFARSGCRISVLDNGRGMSSGAFRKRPWAVLFHEATEGQRPWTMGKQSDCAEEWRADHLA